MSLHIPAPKIMKQELGDFSLLRHLWIAVNDLGPALGYAVASGWLPAELPAVWEDVLVVTAMTGPGRSSLPARASTARPRSEKF